MKSQGLDIRNQQYFSPRTGNNPRTSRRSAVWLSALLAISGTSLLMPMQANAETLAQVSTPIIQQAQVPTGATVIYVNPQTGSDTQGAGTTEAAPYKTITFALQQAQPGTIVQLAPGNYSSDSGEQFPLNVKPGVTLQGDESTRGQTILITGSGQYTSRTFARQNITILAGKDSVINGVSVTNPEMRGTGIWVESTNPAIKNSTFVKNKREGIFVTGDGNPKIENNVFSQNAGNGVSVAKTARGEIRGNLFQNTGFGLAVGGTSAPLIVENQIIQNVDGIFVSNSAKPKLRNNAIERNTRDGIVIISNGLPDLGTKEEPGGNFIRENKRYDVNNATPSQTIFAIANDIEAEKISGQVEFVAAQVEKPTGFAVAFTDVPPGYWAKIYIEALSAKGIIAGFPDGSYKPDEPVTRAQFAAIINKAFAPQVKRDPINFRDVSQNFWGYQAIQTAYRGAYLSGYPNRVFKPRQEIPRVQVLVSLANGLGLNAVNQTSLSFYKDAGKIPDYAKDPVAAATARQLVVNYPTPSQLNPNREATRAEVAAFVYQALVNAGTAQALPSPYLVEVSQ